MKKTEQKTPDPEPRTDPWSRVKEADTMASYDKMKLLVYGGTKQGKSRLCALMGERPLIGLAEQQAIPTIRRANPRAAIFQIQTPSDLADFKAMARSQRAAETYDAVALDGVTEAQQLFKSYYTARQGQKAGKEKTSLESFGAIIDATVRLVRELRDLPQHVIVTALDEEESIEGVGIVHRPAVIGRRLPNVLCAHFNAVGYLHTVEESRGLRRNVLFRGNERYLVGAPDWLDDIEPAEPALWLHKMLGTEVPKDVADRVSEWKAKAESIDVSGDDGGADADDDDDDGES